MPVMYKLCIALNADATETAPKTGAMVIPKALSDMHVVAASANTSDGYPVPSWHCFTVAGTLLSLCLQPYITIALAEQHI